jgi:hypothetical protein
VPFCPPPDLNRGSNLGRCGGKLATNLLNYDTALLFKRLLLSVFTGKACMDSLKFELFM